MLSKCFCRREWGAQPPAVFYAFRQVQGKIQRKLKTRNISLVNTRVQWPGWFCYDSVSKLHLSFPFLSSLSFFLKTHLCLPNTKKQRLLKLECFQLSHWAASLTTPLPCCQTSGSEWSFDTTIWQDMMTSFSITNLACTARGILHYLKGMRHVKGKDNQVKKRRKKKKQE